MITEERENIDDDAKPFARKTKEIGRQGLREGASLVEVVRFEFPNCTVFNMHCTVTDTDIDTDVNKDKKLLTFFAPPKKWDMDWIDVNKTKVAFFLSYPKGLIS